MPEQNTSSSSSSKKMSNELAITLPCSESDFGNFIRSLLGKPQSLTNLFEGPFDFGKRDIEEFHYLLMDRLNVQNKVQLALFSAKIVYDDKSTYQLNDFENFKQYLEIKPLVSTAVHLTWEFLVKFQDRNVPEKQTISVSLVTGSHLPEFDADAPFPLRAISHTKGIIFYRIDHTARSWASDIDALLSNHIKNIIPIDPFWKRWTRKNAVWIGLLAFLVLSMSFTMTSVHITNDSWGEIQSALRAKMAPADLGQRILILSDYLTSGAQQRADNSKTFSVFLSVIVSLALSIWIGTAAGYTRSSYVRLTRKSEENKQSDRRREKRVFTSFLAAIIFALLTGVAGNFLFSYYCQGWRL
jgi:hypothetical protein